MQTSRRLVASWLLSAALACWAVLLGAGAAQAEDWTPPPGAPPGCQPPPGECFPPEQPTQPQPTSPPTPPQPSSPQPTPTAVDQGSESGTTATKSPSADAKQATESKQPPDQGSTRTQEPGGDLGPGEGGTSPTLVIASPALRIGEPTSMPISVIGLNPDENPEVEAIVTITGGIGEASGARGATLTFQAPASDLVGLLASLVVTPQAEQVEITVRAYPVGKPEAAVTAARTLTVAMSESASPTSGPASSSQQSVAPATLTPTAQPSPTPTLQARSISLPAYDPLDEPEQTVGTTVAAVALIGATALAAGSVATSLPGGSGSPGSGPQGPAGGGDTRAAGGAGRREDQATAMLAPGDSGSFLAIDTNLSGLAAAAGAAGMRRRFRTWRLPFTSQLDRAIAAAFGTAARISPLGARMIADSTYLRAMFGSAAVLGPLAGLVLGILGVLDVQGLALAPTTVLLGMVILLGTLDAFAGFIAVVAFTIGIAVSGGITDASSIRTLMGLAIVGFGPALIAGASRPMRRSDSDYTAWERIGDFVVIPLVGAFAVQGTIKALPALSGFQMPIAEQANLLALIALIGLLLRVGLEELAARSYPERISQVAPGDIPPHGLIRRLVLIAVRTSLFGFAAIAFIGNVWQLWVGLAVFAAAEACLLLAPRMPNSPALFHAVPVGVPRFVLIVIVAIGLGTLASLLLDNGADIARTSFVLLLLPGLALAALGMFGREPSDGDVRWYMRPGMRNLYRIGGVLMVIAAVWLTQFAPVA